MKGQGLRVKVQGLRVKVEGLRLKAQGSSAQLLRPGGNFIRDHINSS
jgi:hypothetical protein